MGWSKHHKDGLIYYSPQDCSQGYTLVTPTGGNSANLIDMEGRVCHRWHSEENIGYAYMLPDGHLLLRSGGARQGGQRVGGGAQSGAIRELDWEGNVVWEYHNPMIHHDFERLPNGCPARPKTFDSRKGGFSMARIPTGEFPSRN